MDSHDEEKNEEETKMRLELLRTYPPMPNERDLQFLNKNENKKKIQEALIKKYGGEK